MNCKTVILRKTNIVKISWKKCKFFFLYFVHRGIHNCCLQDLENGRLPTTFIFSFHPCIGWPLFNETYFCRSNVQQLKDNSAVLASKTIETSIFNVNGNSLLGPSSIIPELQIGQNLSLHHNRAVVKWETHE